MAAVVHNNNHHNVDPKPSTKSSSSNQFANWVIPEVIEERRKRTDGRIVCNRYATGKLLGKGGFAKVFVGTLLPSKHEYALKIVSKASLAKERARLKLQSEIKIHKSLDHENIVRFERCFEDNTYYYLLMELCTNQSMTSLLEQRKRITEPEMRYYLRQLIVSLQYLREHLVIHRDLKLGNLFLDGQMKIKVGDFGLAAKLSYESERKKTVCGTPNYIAPEILKSDTGHSFEVDIWSTGVIIYTLLVGKPPFQCKDVKSTYDRILSNTFSFPDHVMVSSEAKNLITRMLQHHPSQRLKLHEILEHSFFTAPHAFTPTTLPESSLRQCPHIEDLTPRTTLTNKLSPPVVENTKGGNGLVSIGDENDPNVLNRLNTRLFKAESQNAVPGQDMGILTRGASTRLKNLYSETGNTAPTAVATASITLASKNTTTSTRPKSAGPLQRRAYQQKFDIFVDQDANTKSSAVDQQTQSQQQQQQQPQQSSSPVSSGKMSTPTKWEDENKRKQDFAELRSRAMRVLKADQQSELNQVQAGLQQVQISEQAPQKRVREAWTSDEPVATTTVATTTSVAGHMNRLSTPPQQILRTKEIEQRHPNTLETLHDMLSSHTFSTTQSTAVLPSHSTTQATSSTVDLMDDDYRQTRSTLTSKISLKGKPEKVVPKTWVVRYVDYTSKYGLGFLLNNGSAGVNFNDSTKIVLSADGRFFQYFERKRKEGSSSSEHVSQRHFLDSYPTELHKKVTLLKHFRNYLLDEEKNNKRESNGSNARDEAEQQAALRQAFSKDALIEPMDIDIPSHQQRSLEEEPELTFVKKYIRTKYAILFRLSNHSVQMIFYDKSEILLSSEAQYITYVNKAGVRSDHYIEDPALVERTDITQRLKFTKDIMYRLITMQ